MRAGSQQRQQRGGYRRHAGGKQHALCTTLKRSQAALHLRHGCIAIAPVVHAVARLPQQRRLLVLRQVLRIREGISGALHHRLHNCIVRVRTAGAGMYRARGRARLDWRVGHDTHCITGTKNAAEKQMPAKLKAEFNSRSATPFAAWNDRHGFGLHIHRGPDCKSFGGGRAVADLSLHNLLFAAMEYSCFGCKETTKTGIYT